MQRGEVETKVCSFLCGASNHCLLTVVRSGARSGVPASSAQLLQFRICGPEAPAFCLFLRLLLPMLRIRGVAHAPERLIWFEPAQHVLWSEIAEKHLHQGDVRRSDVIGGLWIGARGVREASMQLSQELTTSFRGNFVAFSQELSTVL